MKPFERLLVLELGGSAAGAYAGKLFADHGARVLLIEPPGGSPLRRAGEDGGDAGALFAYLNTSKRSRVLDLSQTASREELERWLGQGDVVIESASPDPLDPITSTHEAPNLVRVYISPFGLTGPYSRYRSNEFTDDAIGGHLYLNGEPHREPITRPGHHSEYQAGVHAFIGAMAALRAREQIGRGQTVEVSHFEGLASMHQHTTVMWTHAGHVLRREGNRQPGMWHPVGVYPCKDGHVSLALAAGTQVRAFLAAAGLTSLVDDRRFASDLARARHKREFDAAILPWLLRHTAAEIIELGQEVFAPVGPVVTMRELLEDEHLGERDFWRRTELHASLVYPRGPFRIERRDSALRAPPALGELGASDLPGDGSGGPASTGPARPRAGQRSLSAGPLDGLRVLDLTRVWAGPLAARILADLGADVIAIEAPWARGPRQVPADAPLVTHLFPDNDVGERPWNRVGAYNKLSRNKRGITLALNRPRGRALFEDLVRHADVLVENFAPRVMPQLGLDEERLLELNPQLVYVSMPGYGRSGPKRDWVAFGPLIEAGAGLSQRMGYADSGPYRSGVAWPDPVSGIHAVAATLIALWERETDPERRGRIVEVPMIEATIACLGEQLLAAQLRGADPPRTGNRHPERAPQGCYPCAGDDCWIAISVASDDEWRALCELAGLGAAFAGLDHGARLAQHDAIDAALARWTRAHPAAALMGELQSRGVIACRVADARALVEDPHLEARRFWVEHDHPDAGRHRVPGIPIRLSETPATFRRAAPRLGEHNAEVLRELLQLDRAELEALEAAGVIAAGPPERLE